MPEHGGRLLHAAEEFGIALQDWLDLSTGINPNPYPVTAIPLPYWQRLPEDEDGLLVAAAKYYGNNNLLACAGSQAVIKALPWVLPVNNSSQRVGIISPGYNEHAHAWQSAGFKIEPLQPQQLFSAALDSLKTLHALVIINPNNPTGDVFSFKHLKQLQQALQQQQSWLIVDEAFIDSTPEQSLLTRELQPNLLVLRSVGKFFGLAGARAGFVFAPTAILEKLDAYLGPWSVNNPTRFVLKKALADFAWQESNRDRLQQQSERLKRLLDYHNLTANGGCALFQWSKQDQAQNLYQQLAQQGVLVRLFKHPIKSLRFGLPGSESAWSKLEQALAHASKSQSYLAVPKPADCKAKTLMIQGTTSDAGKSILVTGLARVFKRLGYKVAPFKPQNMALNSAVTNDGGEIGRAQALQAQASGIDSNVHLNPVLLKPNSDLGAQVIIQGKAIGNMKAQHYHEFKPQAMKAVLDSHQRLAKEFELILVEGAGSPAEINLRKGDIANMGFAEAVDCPVILIADINRGGVFAHLLGTLELLSASEQQRVAGFVINRFRGDLDLLKPGLDWLEQRTGKPVFGVLPFLPDLTLDAEDSINTQQQLDKTGKTLKIVVCRLARISNHNDFDPLRQHPQVDLVFSPPEQTLPACDLVIIPGSKSVRQDLQQLQNSAWPAQLQRHLRYGGKLMGICGGFQMLGQTIKDPEGVESTAGISQALGFFDLETILTGQKQLSKVEGTLIFQQAKVRGYEIHAGQTQGSALESPLLSLDNGLQEGAVSADQAIIGTYLHGLFDSPASLLSLLRWAGLPQAKQIRDYDAIREEQIDRLADSIEDNLMLDKIRRLLH